MKKTKKTFVIKENGGNLPYILTWISLDGRLCCENCSNFEDAKKGFLRLKILGREPTVLLNLSDKIEK